MSKPQTEMLVQRVDRLERENRLLKRTGVAALAAIAAVMLMGQALPSKVTKLVEAEKFLVRDTAGNPRAWLGFLPDGSPGLNLIDKDGNIRMTVGMTPQDTPSLNLYDTAQRNRAVLATIRDGSPALVLFNKAGEHQVLLGSEFPLGGAQDRPASSLLFFDKHGKIRTSLIVESTGVAGLRVHDENSKVRTALTATHDGSAILGFLDKDGKVIWKAP